MIDREQAIEAAKEVLRRYWAASFEDADMDPTVQIVDAILALPPQVTDEMVAEALVAFQAVDPELPLSHAIRAALVAALSLGEER